jgi:hypothetical protein
MGQGLQVEYQTIDETHAGMARLQKWAGIRGQLALFDKQQCRVAMRVM